MMHAHELPFRALDHVMVRTGPGEAERLMELFSGPLGLPVSWPFRRLGDSLSYGWVTLGNTNLEFWAPADNGDLPAGTALPLLHGFALDPGDLEASLALAAARGIAVRTPRPSRSRLPDGREVTNFTNAVIDDLSGPACSVFYCAWDAQGTVFPWDRNLAAPLRQARERQSLEAAGGGPLGVTGLRTLRLSAPQPEACLQRWRAFAASTQPLAALGLELSVGPGPQLRLDTLVVGVQCLARARQALADARLLGPEAGGEIRLAPEGVAGLDIRFAQG